MDNTVKEIITKLETLPKYEITVGGNHDSGTFVEVEQQRYGEWISAADVAKTNCRT
ncbi:hypothetical protein [Acinetobacter sp.]|uniref:hypothetical protein n=1 Tax=Acinetobacter sp. TaxID=472 RepID=UPI0025BCA343|nr:hypothetical protein [Acinetobacter sp.]